MHHARALGALGTLLILILAAPLAAQTWTQLTPSPDPTYGSPSPRQGHTAIYNPTSNRMIIFGGGGGGGYGLVGDTWVLTHADGQGGTPAWVRLLPGSPNGAPGPREWHTAVYDLANNRMILHGGYTAPGACEGVVNDTWILTNADGTGGTPQWVPSVPGPPRRFSGPAYDAANNRMIIHGGQAAGCGDTNDDTWVLSEANGLGGAGTWTLLEPAGPRSLPGNESAAYEPSSNTLIVFDLRCDASGCWNVIRRLTGANGLAPDPTWQQLSAEVPTRYWQCGAYDPSRKNLLIFGGQWTTALNDTLVLSNADGQETPSEWSTIAVAGTLPPGRGFCSAVYNSTSDRLIIFGGAGDNLQTPYNDVWVLSEALGTPTNQPPVANAGPNQTVIVGEIVTFDGSASQDPDGTIASFSWDFGDSTTGSGAAATKAYSTAGVYSVVLTVTDDMGASSTDTATVTVLTAGQAIQSLASIVQSFNLQQGITNSLDSKIQNAFDALSAANAGQRSDAANKLSAFINSVEAQRGKQLTNAQADTLEALAHRILAVI